MDASTDWRGFQEVFHPRRRSTGKSNGAMDQVVAVVQNQTVVAANQPGPDGLPLAGRKLEECLRLWPQLKVYTLEDMAVRESFSAMALKSSHENLPVHILDQSGALRSEVKSVFESSKRGKRPDSDDWVREHFLLVAIRTWWSQFLPRSYGIYLRLDGQDGSKEHTSRASGTYYLGVQNRRVERFFVPDLSLLPADQHRVPAAVVKFLSQRMGHPVQGVFVTQEQWLRWSDMKNPWPEINETHRKTKSLLVPSSFGVSALIRARALFGV